MKMFNDYIGETTSTSPPSRIDVAQNHLGIRLAIQAS